MSPLSIARALVALLLGLAAAPAIAAPVAVVNARLLTMGPQGDIARGTVIFDGGRITAVGANLIPPAGARVIDAAGAIVTPGLIASSSVLGVMEVNSVRGSADNRTNNGEVS